MEYEWNPAKAASNLARHGVAFDDIDRLDWNAALIIEDARHRAERRLIAYAPIGERLHVCVFTMRAGRARIISFRKANNREITRYMEAINAEDQKE